MNILTYSSNLIDDQEFIEQWTFARHCIRCNMRYTEKENIGQFRCWQHAFLYDPNDRINRSSCCGLKFRGYKIGPSAGHWGCIRADHTQLPIPYNEMHKIYISKSMISSMLPPKADSSSGIEYVNNEPLVVVYRHDFREENKKIAQRDLLFVEGLSRMSQ